ncbi:beta-propeller domain-containing protein [Candidatus Laterigemmans baculatus]|uniref:beta-propeller domain-containing protein n=1 Tax=Candidatus Laterigemmans baculatus TaxID=2770505 RepID=UPI0013D8FDF5|nr:prolyl oligopeptidase family serine peptidase [Candidatus Laterigemmans baculatus]
MILDSLLHASWLHRAFVFLPLLFAAADVALAQAKSPTQTGTPRSFLAGDYETKVFAWVNADNTTRWKKPIEAIHDCQLLDNGHVLYQSSFQNVIEVDGQGREVWRYEVAAVPPATRAEIHAFRRLPNGRTMIAESGNRRIVEVDGAGEIQHSIPLAVDNPDPHRDTRLVRPTPAGTYLVCHEADRMVREYDRQGNVIWTHPIGTEVYSAVRLENGNTLIGSGGGHRVVEVTPTGKEVWSIEEEELPGVRLAWVTLVERLPSGNTWIVNCHAGPENPQILEVTPEKKIVWTMRDFDRFGNSLPIAIPVPATRTRSSSSETQVTDEPISAIERRLPPVGSELSDEQRTALEQRLEALTAQAAAIAEDPRSPDVEVLLKAVRFALELDEFYRPGDVKKADRVLDEAARRIDALSEGHAPWTALGKESGESTNASTADSPAVFRTVRGYRSHIDGSLQPYGVEIPAGLDESGLSGASASSGSDPTAKRRVPLYVWLHGRGDTTTDLHFIDQRLSKPAQIAVSDGIIVHPFGRHCVGFKHAGEIDVLRVIDEAVAHYPVDPDRVVLIGFSMGGAGVWHIGAHFADRFLAAAPGAGFAETAQYVGLKPEQYPPEWEQTLWRVYDTPRYARNLLNLPVIAYSGENDKQIQAARVMETALAEHDAKLDHRIGPGMGHKYHPEVLAQLLSDLREITTTTPDPFRPLHLQTQTLRYPKLRWVTLTELDQHYRDTRVDAVRGASGEWEITTKNVRRMRVAPPEAAVSSLHVDGDRLLIDASVGAVELVRDSEGRWQLDDAEAAAADSPLVKRPGLQGPIDDAFREPFLVVVPTGEFRDAAVERWTRFELQHFLDRWKALMRGEARVRRDVDVSDEDLRNYNLIVWGDPQSNRLLQRIAADAAAKWPLRWSDEAIELGGQRVAAEGHVPTLIYPNPLAPQRYVVLNSGLTFREAQDRTNSLQNPRLPDWAVIGLDRDPDAEQPGEILAAGFFDESWQAK